MRVLLSGGGTGGHVYPILAVVSALRQDKMPAPAWSNHVARGRGEGSGGDCTLEMCYVGEKGGIEEKLAARAGIPFTCVDSGQIRGRAPWDVARSMLRMSRGASQAGQLLARFRPDAVLVTGGYVTAPVAWASWRRRIPLLIYLPDLTPGLAVQRASKFAQRVAVSFPEAAVHFGAKAVVTGYPVRPELLAAERGAARRAFGLAEDLPVLLVFGGSRGARSINQALIAALPTLLPCCQILHISGELDWPQVSQARDAVPDCDLRTRYFAYPYLHDEMVQALAAADLVVARAGASTLGEFPAAGLPSILVPYPYAGQHQHANARYLAERGAALVLEDADLPARLAATVTELLAQPVRLEAMSKAAVALARPDAAENIAGELRKLAKR